MARGVERSTAQEMRRSPSSSAIAVRHRMPDRPAMSGLRTARTDPQQPMRRIRTMAQTHRAPPCRAGAGAGGTGQMPLCAKNAVRPGASVAVRHHMTCVGTGFTGRQIGGPDHGCQKANPHLSHRLASFCGDAGRTIHGPTADTDPARNTPRTGSGSGRHRQRPDRGGRASSEDLTGRAAAGLPPSCHVTVPQDQPHHALPAECRRTPQAGRRFRTAARHPRRDGIHRGLR